MVSQLELSNLSVTRTGADEPMLRDINLAVSAGEILGIVGESGSGKTLTGLAVMGMLPNGFSVTQGDVSVQGREITSVDQPSRRRARDATMIFQNPVGALNPTMRISAQLVRVLRRNRGLSRRAARAAAHDLIRHVGIPDAVRVLSSYPHQLSGGMTQRIMIAIALACDSSVIVADEPTTALDVTVQAQIFELLGRVVRESDCALVLVTHDLPAVAQLCDRVAVFYAGQVMEVGTTATVLQDPVHPYTRFLMDAVTAEGDPNAGDSGPDWSLRGCRYAHQCPFVTIECQEIPPALVLDESTGHVVSCVRAEELRQ